MTQQDELKGKMINAIIGFARDAAILQNRPFDGATLFFDLAFSDISNLKKICKKLNLTY